MDTDDVENSIRTQVLFFHRKNRRIDQRAMWVEARRVAAKAVDMYDASKGSFTPYLKTAIKYGLIRYCKAEYAWYDKHIVPDELYAVDETHTYHGIGCDVEVMLDALKRLPKNEREMLVRFYLNDEDVLTIAKSIKHTKSLVYARMDKGLRLLREMLCSR